MAKIDTFLEYSDSVTWKIECFGLEPDVVLTLFHINVRFIYPTKRPLAWIFFISLTLRSNLCVHPFYQWGSRRKQSLSSLPSRCWSDLASLHILQVESCCLISVRPTWMSGKPHTESHTATSVGPDPAHIWPAWISRGPDVGLPDVNRERELNAQFEHYLYVYYITYNT